MPTPLRPLGGRRSVHGRLLRCAFLLLLAPTVAFAAEPAAGWRALPLVKDGRIDPAWTHIGWGGFSVEDGALRTEPDPRGLGLLVYQRERFGNCQLRVVFKTKDAKANAGVYVRLSDGILEQAGRPGPAFDRSSGKISKASMDVVKAGAERAEGPWYAVHHGYEIQIADTGDAFHRTGAIYSLAPSTAEAKPGEWRTMIITLAGERITVEIDGQVTTRFDPTSPTVPPRKTWSEPKREPRRPQAGYIGLQNHDPGEIVWYREISLRPLP